VARTYARSRTGKRRASWCLYACPGVRDAPQRIRKRYRRRFGIESSYRQMKQVRARTTSPNPALRFLLMGVALLILNVWISLHWLFLRVPGRGPARVARAAFRLDRMRSFLTRAIERNGQPALDLACGTGRLLLPLLRAGLDVDGCDLSPDMLTLCRAQAEREGLAPRLYAQAMHALDLPRTYRTIYICDSFGLGGQRQQDVEALRRCYRHLASGGTLVFNHYLPYANAKHWLYWLREQRRQLQQAWPASGTRRQAANGDEYELRSRLIDLDPLEQRMTLQTHAALWRAGQLVAEEGHTLQESMYFRNEVLLLLEQAGFADVMVHGSYTDATVTADQDMLVFIAQK
jgi:SAM-dependent methyltransferase